MDAEELASYRYQLEQVDGLLAEDPDNAEMLKLKRDLEDLIALSADLVGSASAEPPAPQRPISLPDDVALDADEIPRGKWAVGDRIRAKYKGDGKLYSARVVSVGGSDMAPVYSVTFKGYEGDAPEIVAHTDTRRLMGVKTSGGHANGPLSPRQKRSADDENDEDGKRLKGTAGRRQRQTQQRERQAAWLKFAGGGNSKKAKKTTAASILNKKSMFATPDNPHSRVGVVGSGRPMTQFGTRGRHVYEEAQDGESSQP
ncbi:hypothetical protein THASP1DRAFT_17437 [Thamnocephalis sphaerospora]|uniref:Tudor domain-containing protein n=1 Tax=Thamnocephalis sphaerospora TaxID=78915 RepID=A0A4V1IWD6_9FUNG|nr:hypothetical protein THASP1DRAFT_17437 [Thamnocephalis sphaerospora]|eukprot:RKP07189.1 hypothetical protein THASP1DRAFT_17437 [Thamnocephalis sphaerospora]